MRRDFKVDFKIIYSILKFLGIIIFLFINRKQNFDYVIILIILK